MIFNSKKSLFLESFFCCFPLYFSFQVFFYLWELSFLTTRTLLNIYEKDKLLCPFGATSNRLVHPTMEDFHEIYTAFADVPFLCKWMLDHKKSSWSWKVCRSKISLESFVDYILEKVIVYFIFFIPDKFLLNKVYVKF